MAFAPHVPAGVVGPPDGMAIGAQGQSANDGVIKLIAASRRAETRAGTHAGSTNAGRASPVLADLLARAMTRPEVGAHDRLSSMALD